MKRDTFKVLFAMVVFVALTLFVLNPAFAVPDCYVGNADVWDGDHVIRTIDERDFIDVIYYLLARRSEVARLSWWM
jgi:hypothetical protein